MNILRPVYPITLCIALLSLAVAGCDSTSAGEDAPPTPPPTEAFSLQTDLFQTDANKTTTRTNFSAAALRVWPVSVIISANLIVPVAVTAAALQDEPEVVDGTWVWSTTTNVDGQLVEFTLAGRPDGEQVDWSMRITTSEPVLGQVYDDFELYTAQTNFDGQEGAWQLFYRIDGERRNVLNADFEVLADDTKELTYSIPEAQPNGGDSVLYATQGDDRRFLWQQVTESLDHDVEWDAVTRVGSISATNYNDGQRSCWDANLDDVACSN